MAKKKSSQLLFGILAAVFLVAVVSVFVMAKKDYTEFATCLSSEGFVMAGTEWCPHCQSQKQMFRGAFEDVITPAGAYKDCDRQKDWCTEHEVTGYPTWFTPEGIPLRGVQELETLAQASGCPLP